MTQLAPVPRCAQAGCGRSIDPRRFLILGGTGWLGGHVARAALDRGHEVVCLARGVSGSVPEGTELVRADRTSPGAHEHVATRRWDVVVDVSSQPGQVAAAARALAGNAERFVYVSSASVYATHDTPGADEHARLLPALDLEVMESPETYGRAKVACEQHVRCGFGTDRALIVRAGLIAGPGDVTDRTGYWPWRFARPAGAGGRVLVPDALGLLTQVIDVRDLAAWLVDAGTAGVSGTLNAMGEAIPLGDHLETARAVAGHTGPVVPADQEWLLSEGVEPWMGPRSLPLWVPGAGWRGFGARDTGRARRAGLATRPLVETLTDTLCWELERALDGPRRAGLSDADERELLAALTGG